MVASNAFVKIGSMDIATGNPISAALLKRNRAADLSIRQAVLLSKALSAAMLKKNTEAASLAMLLPIKYQEMISRILNNN